MTWWSDKVRICENDVISYNRVGREMNLGLPFQLSFSKCRSGLLPWKVIAPRPAISEQSTKDNMDPLFQLQWELVF